MTKNRREKQAARKLAQEQGISYTEALRAVRMVQESRDAGEFDEAWDSTDVEGNWDDVDNDQPN